MQTVESAESRDNTFYYSIAFLTVDDSLKHPKYLNTSDTHGIAFISYLQLIEGLLDTVQDILRHIHWHQMPKCRQLN